jgi:tetratricopeptide (TPR) repeat protein
MSSRLICLLHFMASRKAVLALLLILLATIFVYSPGLRGPFVFDDQPNITFNLDVALTDLKPESLRRAALSNQSGPLGRPLPALTFGLNYYVAGGFKDTFIYKMTNLVIHLINAILVYWLSFLLLKQLSRSIPDRLQPWLPGLIAGAWALHPLLLTSVLYVVQRMTSLSAMFVLAGLITFVYGRQRLQQGDRHSYLLMTVGLIGGTLLGLTSKENAALLPLLIVVVELVIFDRAAENLSTRRRLYLYYGLMVLLPAVIAVLWLVLHFEVILSGYAARDFTLVQRLLTEARVLWFYVGLIFFPRIGAFGIYHDDITISTGLLAPWTTLPAVLGLIAAAAAALTFYRRYPLFSFAVLWFLATQSMESSFIPLEIAHEHRNYLPSFGIIMGGISGLALAAQKLRRPRFGTILLVCYITVFAGVTYSRAHTWASEEKIIETAARNHPRSARSQYILAELYSKKGDALAAMLHYKRTAELDPIDPYALIKIVITASETTVNGAPTDVNGDARLNIPGLPEFVSPVRVADRTTLQVSDTIINEIERRLREEIVRAHTSFTLGLMSFCVNRGQKSCAHLYERVVRWYELALNNPKNNILARSYLAGGLARLYLDHGDYAKALAAAKQSRQYNPNNAELWLEEAEAYLRLNNPEQAANVIEHTRRTLAPLDAATSSRVQELLAKIDTKLKTRNMQ